MVTESTTAADKAAADKAAADKATAERAAAAKSPSKPAYRGNLSPASESSDPTVHSLLAQRAAHESNASTDIDPAIKEQRDAANKAIKEIDDKLADLGYSAK